MKKMIIIALIAGFFASNVSTVTAAVSGPTSNPSAAEARSFKAKEIELKGPLKALTPCITSCMGPYGHFKGRRKIEEQQRCSVQCAMQSGNPNLARELAGYPPISLAF